MPATPHIAGFARLITALDPWLDQVVIIGGWAHRLYRLDPRAQKLDFAPLMTLDTDVALPPKVPDRVPSIRELLVENGFEEEFRGDDNPPATLYRLGDDAAGFYAEFLTPLVGGGLTRTGKRKATLQVAGVISQQLRHIELLLHDPWSVQLDPEAFGIPDRKLIQIANPVSFIAQKLLIHKRREPLDRAKDILYIHDTLQVFGARLDQLGREWTSRIRPRLHPKAASTVTRAPDWLFGQTTDVIRAAVAMAVDRRLTPEAVRESCRYALQQVVA